MTEAPKDRSDALGSRFHITKADLSLVLSILAIFAYVASLFGWFGTTIGAGASYIQRKEAELAENRRDIERAMEQLDRREPLITEFRVLQETVKNLEKARIEDHNVTTAQYRDLQSLMAEMRGDIRRFLEQRK